MNCNTVSSLPHAKRFEFVKKNKDKFKNKLNELIWLIPDEDMIKFVELYRDELYDLFENEHHLINAIPYNDQAYVKSLYPKIFVKLVGIN